MKVFHNSLQFKCPFSIYSTVHLTYTVQRMNTNVLSDHSIQCSSMLKYIHLSISLSHKFFMTLFAVPNLLEKAITATRSSLKSQLQILQERVSVLTASAESCVRTPIKPEREEIYAVQEVKKEAEGEEGSGEPTELHKISRQQVQIVLDGLATARQLEVYLRCLPYVTNRAHWHKFCDFCLYYN